MKVMINRASKLHDKLLNICAAQYNKLSEQSQKRVSVWKPEMLILDFNEDELPPMPPLEGEEEVKLEPEDTIAERIMLNPRKKK